MMKLNYIIGKLIIGIFHNATLTVSDAQPYKRLG